MTSGSRVFRLSVEHVDYAFDVSNDFDFYFEAVESVPEGDLRVVDCSRTRLHRYRGFPDFAVLTPSLPEPVSTIQQYFDLAGTALSDGATVIDLGAYSGLSSMLLLRRVGTTGRVIAVEPDPVNFMCCSVNFHSELLCQGFAPSLVQAAAWNEVTQLVFSGEGNLGSGVRRARDDVRGASLMVQTMTLSEIARRFHLSSVDVLKMDIEGSEVKVLSDDAFFREFRPLVVLEAHSDALKSECARLMRSRGYRVTEHQQEGSPFQLMTCLP